jgi:hypothetical protein
MSNDLDQETLDYMDAFFEHERRLCIPALRRKLEPEDIRMLEHVKEGRAGKPLGVGWATIQKLLLWPYGLIDVAEHGAGWRGSIDCYELTEHGKRLFDFERYPDPLSQSGRQ